MIRLAVDNGAPRGTGEERRKRLAKVHMGKKALGIADDDYRALLERVTGHRSAGDCTSAQLDALLTEFARMGFGGSAQGAAASAADARAYPPRATGVVVGKARALWISLYQLGAIDNPSERALEAFGQRQLKVDRLNWMHNGDGFRLIEALKAMAQRHGWDQRIPARTPARAAVRLLKDRLVGAQLARLTAAGVPVTGPLAADRDEWSDRRLEAAAQELAAAIRQIDRG
jgi:phage gp16-like protein